MLTFSIVPPISLASRRMALAGLGLAAVAGLALALTGPVLAQKKEDLKEVAVDELLKPGDLPDMVMGKDDAPVTIVEYASMTCGHCAQFSKTVFPEIKTKYIDTGKVRFIFREFPLDNLAAAVSMLGRCVGDKDKAFALNETFFATQENWARSGGSPVPKLFDIAKQAGFTQESFDTCLKDQKLLDQVTAVRTRGAEKFGVNSTPTLFVNGKKTLPTMEDLSKAIDAAAPEKK